jgi:hypothetical protein
MVNFNSLKRVLKKKKKMEISQNILKWLSKYNPCVKFDLSQMNKIFISHKYQADFYQNS